MERSQSSTEAELEAFLATADESPTLLHPNMAWQYRTSVQNLYDALQGEDEGHRVAAAEVIRSLVDKIVLTPVDGEIEIDVKGDLAGILVLSSQTQDPATKMGSSQVKLVAGGRLHHNLHTTAEHNELSILTELSDRIGLFCVAA